MVYTLNGPGPLRGLPSLSLTSEELAEEGTLERIGKAVTDFNMTPGKRIIKIDFVGDTPISYLTMRSLKTRGFLIYGVVDGGHNPAIQWVDAIIVERSRGPWPMVGAAAYCYVREDGEELIEPEFIPEVAAVPKYLIVDKVDKVVMRFLHEARYLWNVQLPSQIIKVDV